MSYAEKLKDPRWQKKRLCVMKRDEFKCRDCGDGRKTLQVHHCMYEKGETWDTSDRFLMTLCESCHEKRGALESDAKRALGMLFAILPNATDDNSLRAFVTSLIQNAEDPTVSVVNGEFIQKAVDFGRGSVSARKGANGR